MKMFLNNGFTLVETLVAISILLLVITGPLTIATRAGTSSSFSSEQAVAYFLAQEGLELAQKGRDQYLLQYLRGGSTDTRAPWLGTGNPNNDAGFLKDGNGLPPSGPFSWCMDTNGCGMERGFGGGGGLYAYVTAPPSNARSIQQCPAPSDYMQTGANGCRLYYNLDPATNNRIAADRGIYTHVPTAGVVSLEPTPFTRVIRFQDITSSEVKVVSTVYWRTGTLAMQSVSLETYLFNTYAAP